MLEMEDTMAEKLRARLGKMSTLGLSQRLTTAVLYTARFSVYPGHPSSLEITSSQAFILALFRSFLVGDAAAVFSLLPLAPQLPQLQSCSIAVWFREDFSFKRQDVTRALSWLARFIKREGPVVPLNILLVFSSLEEKYKVFSYFKEVGDTIGQEMLIYLIPLINRATQARLQDNKDQSVDASPLMVTKGTQTSMTFSQDTINSIPLTASISKDHPVVYAAYQNVQSIQTETILEEPENLNEAPTRTTLVQQPKEHLTFLVQSERTEPSVQLYRPISDDVRSSTRERRSSSDIPRSLRLNTTEVPVAESRLSPNNIPTVVIRSPTQERRRPLERPRSLQPDETYSLEEIQRDATTSRLRPSSSIEAFTTEKDGKTGTIFRARSTSILEPMKNSTLKRIAAAAKADATKRLLKAAERGDVEAVSAAIAEGANVDSRDSLRRTPLHLAVAGGHEDVARRLLAAGAERDRKDCLGRTPLHYTALRGRASCAQLLVDSGAEPNPRDSSGLTPTALASMKHHSGVAAVLKRKGGQECSIS